MLGTRFYEHPHCTHRDILLFIFLLTNVLIVSPFGYKCLLNALHVNVYLQNTEEILIMIILNMAPVYRGHVGATPHTHRVHVYNDHSKHVLCV